MKATLKVKKEFEIKTFHASLGVRYWEDGEVDGVEDTEGTLIPCREGDRWELIIDVETGIIKDWKKGVKASVHYKVCDDGVYKLLDENGDVVLEKEGYVPGILAIEDEGYEDYIIIDIDENGKINDWKFDMDDFSIDEND